MLENAREGGQMEAAVAGQTHETAPGPSAFEGSPSRRDASAEYVETLFSLSRRHDLQFSVVVVGVRESEVGAGSRPRRQAEAGRGDRVARLRKIVESETRETDLLGGWSDTEAAVVFCPATPPEGAKELAQRLRARAGDLPIGVGMASFRQDALTLADLVECARLREAESQGEGSDGDDSRSGSGLSLSVRPRRPTWRRLASASIKRFFDLVVVVGTAPLWLLVTALVASAVKLSDPSARVFFSQQRTGRGGRRFSMYKIRTMVPGAERLKRDLLHRSQRSWPDFKIEDDPRITPIGKWLRSSSFDELPQLWNVLRGDMSLVGPRPTSFPAETYESWQTARLEAVPGLTGLWQIEARNCVDFSERIRLDLRYVANQGFFYDLKILLRTLPAVLRSREGR